MFGDFIAHIIWLWLIFISLPLIFDMSIKEMFQKIIKPLTETREVENENFEDATISKRKSKIPDLQEIDWPNNPKLGFWESSVSIIKPKQIEISEIKEIQESWEINNNTISNNTEINKNWNSRVEPEQQKIIQKV